ncbi:MAG: hypothetical protein ABUL64_03725 [Singulisphaera sp.]
MLLAAGCGGPKVYPVNGEVLIKPEGKPMPGGIEFRPLSGLGEHIARGTIDDAGNFTLETRGLGVGAVPGEYQVILSPATPDDFDGVPLAEQIRILEPIDRQYRDYETTPLRFTVTTDPTQNHFHIEVEPPKNRGRTRR